MSGTIDGLAVAAFFAASWCIAAATTPTDAAATGVAIPFITRVNSLGPCAWDGAFAFAIGADGAESGAAIGAACGNRGGGGACGAWRAAIIPVALSGGVEYPLIGTMRSLAGSRAGVTGGSASSKMRPAAGYGGGAWPCPRCCGAGGWPKSGGES